MTSVVLGACRAHAFRFASCSARARSRPLVFAQQSSNSSSGDTPAAAPTPSKPQMQRPVSGRPAPPALPPGTIMGPDGTPLKVVTLEKADVEGVAYVDKGDSPTTVSKSLLLAGGDLTALLLFAAAGRANHGEMVDLETLVTALPFIVGWFATAPLLGAFGAEAQGSDAKAAAGTAAKCWALATPLGLVLRGLSKGYVPPTPFIAVSMVATGVLLIGWRTALAATTKKGSPKGAADRKNKQGNPFEFMQLLFSLTRRW